MRTTTELIHELQEEAQNAWMACLVIGFEHSSTFVWARDPDRLESLNEAVKHGGNPVGVIVLAREQDDGLTLKARPLAEYADDEHIHAYLADLARNQKAVLEGNVPEA